MPGTNVLFEEFHDNNIVHIPTLTEKFDELLDKLNQYHEYSNIEIINNVETVKREQQEEIEKLQQELDEHKEREQSAGSKLAQMQMALEIASLHSDLKLKELENEYVADQAEEEYQERLEEHKIQLLSREKTILQMANECAVYVEKAVKGYPDDVVNGVEIREFLESLPEEWQEIRAQYLSLIENERKNIEILSLQANELEEEKISALAEYEKCKKEKVFIQEKIDLDIIGNGLDQMQEENRKIANLEREINRITRENKKVAIQRDTSREKIDIIQAMIDGVISEFLAERLSARNIHIPAFLATVKYFDMIAK